MKLPQSYRADDLPKSDKNYDPVPSGWYDVIITSAEVKTTKAGNGMYLATRYDITGPTNTGRVIFGNITLRNTNMEAERIGAQHLGELINAVAIDELEDSDQLVGKNLSIKVVIRESEQYGPQNDVKGWKSNGAQPAAAAAPAAASKAPPWMKR